MRNTVRMRTGALLVLALAAPLAACGPKAAPTTPPPAPLVDATKPAEPTGPTTPAATDDFEALMGDVIGYMGKLADGVEAAGSDCTAMAASIESITSANQELLTRTKAMDADESASARSEQWMQAHEAEIKPMFERLFGGLQKCQGDAGVQAAMEKMTAG